MNTIKGRIFLDNRQPATNLELGIYRKDFGGEKRIATVKTDENGRFQWEKGRRQKEFAFEIKVKNQKGKFISISRTQYQSKEEHELNLIAPSDIVERETEFKNFNQDVASFLNGSSLADAKETTGQQDLSYLYQNTGWDARILAMGAIAEQTAKVTDLDAEMMYGLLRAGLPSDPEQLALVNKTVIKKALQTTNEKGITKVSINSAVRKFNRFSNQTRAKIKLPGGTNSVSDFVSSTGLNQQESKKFYNAYFEEGLRGEKLWAKLKRSNFRPSKISALQHQGKLAYLTLNNGALSDKINDEIGAKTAQLVEKNYHKATTWETKLGEIARDSGKDVAKLIPDAYLGETTEERLKNYANDMARKVRVSYPTQALSTHINPEEINIVIEGKNFNQPVQKFLSNALSVDSGFVLGRRAFGKFVQENKAALTKDIAPELVETTIEEAKTLQRLYQITPDDDALMVCYEQGFKSARDIVAFEEEEFLQYYGVHFKSHYVARLVYRKSRQVSDITYNFFGEVNNVSNSVSVAALSPSNSKREEITNNFIKQFPTLENLFGSLDYCECEHCKSVLSPAAYLVDLLQFLDREESVWTNFIEDWDKNHDNDNKFNKRYKRPYQELNDRRPDISHLELTCENTNTVLPYIDVVNEILEFYVAKSKLTRHAAINTIEGTSTEDLLAEPQNVVPEAYEKLSGSKYPLNLPFDLWVEMVRSFANHFDVPLWKLMEKLRKTDLLDIDPANQTPYAYRAIFSEYLGHSPFEYKIFTEGVVSNWFELFGYTNEANALSELSSAKLLSRKLDVTYKELVELIQTQFLNVKLANLVTLRRVGLDIRDIYSYKEQPGYTILTTKEKNEVEKKLDSFGLTLDWIEETWNNGGFEDILVLFDVNTDCNFDETIFRYANADAATRLDFLKLNLFVRLQKKLDWSVQELDNALITFLPENAFPITEANVNDAFKTILLYLSHLKWLDENLNLGKQGKLKLLSFWGDINTVGKDSLYEQYFLNPVMLREDSIFDNNLGHYLEYFNAVTGQLEPFNWDNNNPEDKATGNVKLANHINPVKAAFGMTTDEVERVLTEAGKSLDEAPLNFSILSHLHRYRAFADGLGIDIYELISLIAISGVNPFLPLEKDFISQLEKDHPHSSTIAFVKFANKIKESNFSFKDLDYLLRHQFDVNGNFNPDASRIINLAKTIRTEINRIKSTYRTPDNVENFTEEELFQSIALVYNSDLAASFQEMWLGTKEWTITKPDVALADKIGDDVFNAAEDVISSYNEIRQEQTITYIGVLTKTRMEELRTTFIGSTILSVQQEAHLSEILDRAYNFFFENISFIYPSSVDLENEYQKVFDGQSPTRKENLVPALLRSLIKKQIDQFIEKTLENEFDASPEVIQFLLSYLSINDLGVSVNIQEVIEKLDQNPITLNGIEGGDIRIEKTEAKITKAEIGAATKVTLSGYLEVPANGDYRFFIKCNANGTKIKLNFNHLGDDFIPEKTTTAAEREFSGFLYLNANTPYQFVLEADALNDAQTKVIFDVQGENLIRGDVARIATFSTAVIERLAQTYQVLFKSVMLIQTLELSDREIQYLAEHKNDFDEFDFNDLPTNEVEGQLNLSTRFYRLIRIIEYSYLKSLASGGSDDLITIFENASKTNAETQQQLAFRFAQLIRRPEAEIQEITDFLTLTSVDFRNEKGLQKIWEIAKIAHQFGVSINALSTATLVIDLTKSNEARYQLAGEFKNAIKARYSINNWRKTAPSVFDPIRQIKRDALVSYIMHKNEFARREQLFEFFLIDPGMEPVVKTSRIKLAISSVQLFIQRCLLNLEGPIIDSNGDLVKKGITPKSILSKHWEWMKRYRVWEANRKIFLYPENWLEPEFRDDKTHLYEELEGALLQGDVSQDLVEQAFFNYLKQLEKISRLDMRAMYCEQAFEPASNTLHVLGRTFNLPHEYYYRTYSSGEWTPWVPLGIQIDGNHVTMIKWRDRIHVFWLTFLEKAKSTAGDDQDFNDFAGSKVNQSANKDVDIQLNWTEYYQGEWTTREAGGIEGDDVITLENVGLYFDKSRVFVHSTKVIENGIDREVEIHVRYSATINKSFKLQSKLSRPEEGNYKRGGINVYPEHHKVESRYKGRGSFEVDTVPETIVKSGEVNDVTGIERQTILEKSKGAYYLLICSTPVDVYSGNDEISQTYANSWISPFFYIDSQYTFFVQPEFREKIIEEWDEWILHGVVQPQTMWLAEDYWKMIPLERVDRLIPPPRLIDPVEGPLVNPVIDNVYDFKEKLDWVINPGTVLEFQGNPISAEGQLGVVRQFEFNNNPDNIGMGTVINNEESIGSLGNIRQGTAVLVDRQSGSIIAQPSLISSGGLQFGQLRNIINRGANLRGFRNTSF